jgi:hypothetical protein
MRRRMNWTNYWRDRRSLLSFCDHKWKEECSFLGSLQFFAPLDEQRVFHEMFSAPTNRRIRRGPTSYTFLDIKSGDLLDVMPVKVSNRIMIQVANRTTNKVIKLNKQPFWGRHLEWWVYHDLVLSSYNVEGYIDLDQTFRLKAYSLPRSGGVYVFFDSDKRPLYVGKAKHLGVRFKEHFSNLKRYGRLKYEDEKYDFKYICYITAHDLLTQSALEFFFIKHLKPPLNAARVNQTQIILPDVRSEISLTHL